MLIVFSLMIFAGVAVLWLAMSNRRALREMEHRERLAMIQAGMVPAPEADPLAFETQLEPHPTTLSRKDRWRTAGTLTVGLGLALLVLLSFTGDSRHRRGSGRRVRRSRRLVPAQRHAAEPDPSRRLGRWSRRTSTGTPPPPDPPSSAPF